VRRVNQVNRIARAIVWSPVIWGGLATLVFYVPLEISRKSELLAQTKGHAFLIRYFCGHWVEYITMTMFCIGVAALVLKVLNLVGQKWILNEPMLDQIPPGGQDVAHCEHLLARLAKLPYSWQDSYLVRRLREALEFVYRKNSAAGLDEEIRYLSDLDAGRMQSSYALLWFIIWAVPIMGFLGTIIGITGAVGNLSPKALEDSLSGVTSGLGVAFDTTALSLSLSIVLMFVKYFVERFENQLLGLVDERTNAELVGRFVDGEVSADPDVNIVRRIAENVLGALDQVVVRQTELWQQSLRAMHEHWSQQTQSSAKVIETSLAAAMNQSVQQHAQALASAERTIAAESREHWQGVQQALLQNADAVANQQREMSRQTELLTQVVGAADQVARLESELNRNLSALAGARHFEETVVSLSAAISLLSTRLSPADAGRVDLKSSTRKGQAA
jgi:hypothetical protein